MSCVDTDDVVVLFIGFKYLFFIIKQKHDS